MEVQLKLPRNENKYLGHVSNFTSLEISNF